MNLQNPKKFKMLIDQAHESALNVLRPISRKYDKAEHSYPKELDMFASIIDGMNDGGEGINAGAAVGKRGSTEVGNKNGVNMSTVLGVIEMCYGDTGLLLSMPRQGLGNSAIAAVANDEQLERFKGTWAAMAITESGCGSDSAAIRTTATKDGDDYILNGEKIFVTSGERADSVVVWATLDKKLGRAAIKSFVVPKGTSGMKVERLEHKLVLKLLIPRSSVLLTVVCLQKTYWAMLKLMLPKVLQESWKLLTILALWLQRWLSVVQKPL